MEDLIKKLSDKISYLDKKSSFSDGNIISTTIQEDSSGYFVSFIFSEEDNLEKTYFNEQINRKLNDIAYWTENNTGLDDMDISSIDENSEFTIVLKEEPKLYITRNFEFITDQNNLEDYAEYFLTGENSVHTVNIDNIEEVEVIYDPIWDSFDSTCYYYTKEPHKIYSNIETLNEYADHISESSNRSKSEILNQDEYIMHYHPSNKDDLAKIKNNFNNKVSSNIQFDLDPIIDTTKINLKENETSFRISVIYNCENILAQL
jgi:hypothetical protein